MCRKLGADCVELEVDAEAVEVVIDRIDGRFHVARGNWMDELKVGSPAVEGLDVDAKVIGHPRGPRTESIRYKSKKRVRVHHGGRSHLTALEIIAVGGIGIETEVKEEEASKTKTKARTKAAPKKKAAAPKAEAVEDKAEPKKATRVRTTKKGSE